MSGIRTHNVGGDRHWFDNWNIVESGIKHHNPNQISYKIYLKSYWNDNETFISNLRKGGSNSNLTCVFCKNLITIIHEKFRERKQN
jgi:hypothetical protein